MLLTCPNCRAECSSDNLTGETVTCANCGQPLSTRTGDPDLQDGNADISAAKEVTREWRAESLLPQGALSGRHGKYLIKSVIAQGGFAMVLLATDEELGRLVAIKIPRSEKFRSPDKMRQFLDEARHAAKLRHPGIVTIFDVGTFVNGTSYIAMEYVAGDSLAEVIKAERIPIRKAVEWLIQIAEAIHEAHRQGLVHRDLKPSNILLDERGQPRIVDFGLAVHESTQELLEGEYAGTPPYMSPEQFRGEAHRLDGRTDIWSLGIIFYQILTRRRPFEGNLASLRDEVLNKSPKPPRQIDDQIPADLESICLKCLSKSIDGRYTTARDLATDLQQHLQAMIAEDSLHSQRDVLQPVPPLRKRQMLVAGILLAATVILSSLGITSVLILKNRSPDKLAALTPGGTKPLDEEPLLRAVHLIDRGRVPRKLSWPVPGTDDSFDYQLDEGRLTLQNRSPAFVELGSTTAKAIVLEAELSRTGDRGTNGLFWGWQPEASEPNHFSCFTAAITSTPNRKGAVDHRLIIELLRLKSTRDGQFSVVETAGLAGEEMNLKIQPQRGRLSISVSRNAGLQAIAWDGQSFNDLPAFVHGFLASQPTRFPKMRPSGIFGIYNRQGAVLVRNPTIKLISRGDD